MWYNISSKHLLLKLTQLNTQLFLFPQTCASSGESYRLRRKTLVVSYLTIGAAPCILTRNATGLFHLLGVMFRGFFARFFCFPLFTKNVYVRELEGCKFIYYLRL